MLYANNHILYDRNGGMIHFFHTDADGLCIKADAGVQTLLKDAYPDFDLCQCGGALHIVCQNRDGDLIYLKNADGKWYKYTLLVSKTKGAYDKHFFLLPTGSCIQLFYTLRSGGKLLLAQQILGEGTQPQPSIVAPVKDGVQPFFAVADKEFDTFIYYQNEQGVLGCRTYKWSSKSLGGFEPVFPASAETPCVSFDSFGRQHICSVSGKEILYRQRALDGAFTQEAHIPLSSAAAGLSPFLRFEEDKIYIIWKQERNVMYTTSVNDGESFCAPVRVLSSGSHPVRFTLHTDSGRAFALGYFLGGEIKFYPVAAPQLASPVRRPVPQRKQTGGRAPAQGGTADELERLKRAVSALGQELSELKNRFELALSVLDSKPPKS